MAEYSSSPDPRASFPDGIAGEVHGDGPLLLWCHGFTSSRAIEDRVDLYGITEVEGFRIARWDAPGHGASADVEDDETTTWPRLGQLMLDIAHGLGEHHFIAAGASMGTAS